MKSFLMGCLLFCLTVTVQAQLDLPYLEEDPVAMPTTTPEEQEREEQRIRNITRKISNRAQAPVQELDLQQHPGKARYEKIYQRINEAPEQVGLSVKTREGKTVSGLMENRFLNVHTEEGTFPVLWSEVVSIDFESDPAVVTLQAQDRLSGNVELDILRVERMDTSWITLPLTDIRHILLRDVSP